MPSIPYDATRPSLYHPGAADDFFSWGAAKNDAALCAEMSRVAYVNCCDLATRVPPEAVFGYAHADRLAYIDRTGQWLQAPAKSEIAADRIEATGRHLVRHAFLRGTVSVRELADHAPINYVSGAMGLRAPEAA